MVSNWLIPPPPLLAMSAFGIWWVSFSTCGGIVQPPQFVISYSIDLKCNKTSKVVDLQVEDLSAEMVVVRRVAEKVES